MQPKVSISIGANLASNFASTFTSADKRVASLSRTMHDLKNAAKRLDELKRVRTESTSLGLTVQKSRNELLAIKAAFTETAKVVEHNKAKTKALEVSFSDAKAQLEAAKNKVAEFKNELASSEKPTSEQKNKLSSLKDEVKASASSYRAYKDQLLSVRAAYSHAEKAQKKHEREVKRLNKAVEITKRKYGENKSSLYVLSNELSKAGFDTAHLTREQERLAQSLEKTERKYRSLSSYQSSSRDRNAYREQTRNARSGALGAVATATVAGLSFIPALNFEDEFARAVALAKVRGDQLKPEWGLNTPEQVRAYNETSAQVLRKKVTDAARDQPFTASQVMEFAGDYTQAGYSVEQTASAIDATILGARATKADPKTVATLLRGVRASFGKPVTAEYMDQLTNYAVATAASGEATIEDLAESAKYLQDLPASFGLSEHESFGYLGALSKGNLKGSEAGTSFVQLIERLTRKNAQTKLYEKLKIKPYKEIDGKREPLKLIEVIEQIEGRTKNMGQEELLSFFTEVFDTQAARAMRPLVMAHRRGELKPYLASIKQSADQGVAKQMEGEMSDTPKSHLLNVASNLEIASLEVLDAYKNDLKVTAQELSKVIGETSQWINVNKSLVTSTLSVAGTTFKYFLMYKAGRYVFMEAKGAAQDLRNAYKWLTASSVMLEGAERSQSLVRRLLTLDTYRSAAATIKNAAMTTFDKTVTVGSALAYRAYSGVLKTWATAKALTRIETYKTIAAQVLAKAAMIRGAIATGTMTAAQWALNVALNANPIGLVVTGVAALAAGGYALYKYWHKLPELFSSTWQSLKDLVFFWENSDSNKEKKLTVESDDKSVSLWEEYFGEGKDTNLSVAPQLSEPLPIPDSKVIDIKFNYLNKLDLPEKHVIAVDFKAKNKISPIPVDLDRARSLAGKPTIIDQRKVVIEKIIVPNDGSFDEQKLADKIEEAVARILHNQAWDRNSLLLDTYG